VRRGSFQRAARRGAGTVTACTHVAGRTEPAPTTGGGCQECLAEGSQWVHLRLCLSCGRIGCCYSSPRRHANAHFRFTRHPVVGSLEQGEDWRWCFVDETVV